MSYDRRKAEADIGALLHTYIAERSITHTEGDNCDACIGMAEGLINENHFYGTINCDGVNAKGEVCGVTTTSGLAWKIPGRVGDSPILGAGLYLDNEVGAVHGGFATFLLDGAMGRAAVRSLNEGETCATVQLSTQFIAPLAGTLRATGRITKRGKRIGFLDGECVDASGRVGARAQGTWAYFPARA